MADEKDVAIAGDDEPGGEVDADDQDVAEPEVKDVDQAESAEGEQSETAAPKPDAWKGVSWRHRQAAERAKRDGAWASGIGPDVLEGLAQAQDEVGRQFAALGRFAEPTMATDAGQVTPTGVPGKTAAGEMKGAAEFAFDVAALDKDMELPDSFKGGVLNVIQDRFRQDDVRFAKMEAFYQQAQRREQETQEVRALEVLDGVIASPDMADVRDLYGMGPTLALDMSSPQAKARAQLSAMAWQMFIGARKAGQPVELPQAYRWAHSILNAEKIAAGERDKGRKETDTLRRTATRRPAARTPPPEEKTEAEERAGAVEFARGLWKRMSRK